MPALSPDKSKKNGKTTTNSSFFSQKKDKNSPKNSLRSLSKQLIPLLPTQAKAKKAIVIQAKDAVVPTKTQAKSNKVTALHPPLLSAGAKKAKYFVLLTGLFVVLALSILLPTRAIASEFDRAIRNANYINVKLHAVYPAVMLQVVKDIASGAIIRLAPEQPIWIMDSISGTILYYQGQPNFTNQAASRLVDDAGQRFGQVAIDKARQGNDVWLSIALGGQTFRAFCQSSEPTVVCSLALK